MLASRFRPAFIAARSCAARLCAARLSVARLSVACLVPLCLAASPPAGGAALCTPAGGAPGPLPGPAASIGGSIGPGVGGTGVDAFVSQLAGGPFAPPASACGAPASSPGASVPSRAVAEPASVPVADADRSAGNPVDVATGNKYQRQVDVVLPHQESSALSPDGLAAAFGLPRDDSLLLLFARHYNSRSDFALTLGRGWSHSYETRLARIVRDGRIELQIVQGDGRRIVFRSSAAGAGAAARAGAGGRRTARRHAGNAPRSYGSGRIADGLVDEDFTDAAASFVWRWPGGRRVIFDADGRLASIVAPDVDAIRLRRDAAGRLVEVADSSGRTLGLEYAGTRLAALRLPDGQRVGYDYDVHGQLVAVRYPDGRALRYHYEDPRAFHLLTGVTDSDGRRSRYDYDDALRVSRSRAIGRSDAQALRFAYRLPPRPGAGGSTTVTAGTHVSRFQWIDPSGSGGPTLVATDGDGCERCPPMGLRMRRDRGGRTVAVGATRVRHDSFGRVVERRVVDRAGREQWFERLHYGDDGPLSAPTRIERPSVVPGRTLRIAIGYSGRGQVATVDVSGFAPRPGSAEPVAASLRLEYAQGGPAAGKLVSIARDGGPDGVSRTVFVHDAQRRLVRIAHAAVLVHTIDRDPIGRAISERFPDGTQRTRTFDRAWRLASTSHRGIGVRFDYDPAGRPGGVEWSDGRRWTIGLRSDGVEIASNHGWRRVFGGPAPGAPGTRAALPVALARASAGRQSIADARGRRTDYVYDDLGRLVETRSKHAGSRRQRFDALGRLARIEHDDGAVDVREHDLAGRVVRREQLAGDERIETRFGYEGTRLVTIDHPVQRSYARHDALGRLAELTHERDGRRFRQAFSYDPRGRLAGHELPDGSRLRHGYDEQGRAERLALSLAGSGETRWLVQRTDFGAAKDTTMHLGNGVRFERRFDDAGRPLSLQWRRSGVSGASGADSGPSPRSWEALTGADLPFRRLRWHRLGVPLAIAHEHGEDRFGYDRFGRLIARERHAGDGGSGHVEYFLHDANGDRIAARRRDGSDWRSADVPVDASGRPLRHGPLALRYGAQRRIVEARGTAGVTLYRYDAFGQRVARSGPSGDRGFLHHGHALAAESDADGRLLRQYLRWNGQLLAVLEHGAAAGAHSVSAAPTSVAWVHGDHLGTPIAATDASARVVWRGDWDAFGRLARARGRFEQPLRLAGQYFDPETGLHDNLLRTYDPDAGRYLEPDPLGLAAGLNPFSYADGNPMVATDPLGLILFAFDGTNNGSTGHDGDDVSNVRKFFEQYDDPNKWYMAGVGRDDATSGIIGGALDQVEASTARSRVDWMLGTLDGFLGDAWIGRDVPVDVIGFSRGAAMARDFVNRVSTLIDDGHFRARGICVDLRFLGLWDTVAQFGLLGLANERWQLAIPSAVRATYHAVALNEHRSLFPLESALGGSAWVVERGFIGDHADVGGGNAEGDLSDVSLVWMTAMARSTGLPMRELHPRDRHVSDPRLHDRNYAGLGDRTVLRRDASGRVLERSAQRRTSVPGLSWRDSAAFLVPRPRRGIDAKGQPSIVGEVDMNAYAAWLRTSYGIELPD
jgi:RHS repeat-associated protein